jgi:hypothetical protein
MRQVRPLVQLNRNVKRKMSSVQKKVYKKWSPERVVQTVNLIQKHGIVAAGRMLGLSQSGLRIGLWRKGVSLSQLRQRSAINKKRVRGGMHGALVKPSGHRPLAAMKTIENDPGGCRWPTGDLDTDNLRFCCHEKARGSFCKVHAPLVYIGAEPMPISLWLSRYDAAQGRKRESRRHR